jgi:peptidoglycan/LPS O-acetylase OafA/YrhL
VYLQHTRSHLFESSNWLFQVFQEFDCALSIFFVLSGFLIAHRYRASLRENKISLWHYVVQRIARVMPVYLLLTLIYLFYNHQTDWKVWLLNLTLTRAFFEEYLFVGVGPAWSLTVEECFYFSAPLLFHWFNRRFSVWLLTILTISAGILAVLASNWFHLGSFLPTMPYMFVYTFFGRCFAFYAGIKTAEYFEPPHPNASLPRWWKLPHKTLLGFTWMAVNIALSFWLKNLSGFSTEKTTFLLLLNELFFLIPGICLIISGLALERTWAHVFLASKPIELMGKASYIVYLIHAGLFFEIFYFHVTQNPALIYLVVNIISLLGFALFEEPTRKFLVRTFAGPDRRNC